jgi:hypothetical protein
MGLKKQIVDDITTARTWAELVEKGGCTAKVLAQAPEMIGRLCNAERLVTQEMDVGPQASVWIELTEDAEAVSTLADKIWRTAKQIQPRMPEISQSIKEYALSLRQLARQIREHVAKI